MDTNNSNQGMEIGGGLPQSETIALSSQGLSLIPITEGEKKPHSILGPKHDLLTRRSTHEEVEKWVAAGVKSWGVANGAVSGNLVTLDFDEKHYEGLYDLWYARLSDEQLAVVDMCAISTTRNNGHHVRYRTDTPQPTIKLARRVELNSETQKEDIVTTAEVRGEGSQALIPPSAGYAFIQGDLTTLPQVTDEMHEELIDILRTFNEVENAPATEYERRPTDTIPGDRPGDRLNALMSWEEILMPHGWVQELKNHWRRPGKKAGEGISATTDHAGVPMLYVFSSSAAPFTENRGVSKFHAFALLNHDGDFKAAARAAAAMYPSEEHMASLDDYEGLLQAIPKDIPKESLIKVLTPLLEALASGSELAEAEIYIRNKVRTELKLTVKDGDSIVKHFKAVRTRVLGKIAEKEKQAEQGLLDAPLTEEEKVAAVAILKSPTLLYDVLQMVKKLGVVGEERNVLLHYLIFTSRKLKHPLSATVKGDSAAGKSFTLLTTAKVFPKSAYIDLTDATSQSFYYTPDDYFKHRIIVIFEKHGGERADYAIRTLQSEGKLKIQVTIKNPETGQFEAQTIEKEGPTGFITTTTASVIHSENDTRNISMFPDQSSEQTARVYESVDARYLGIRTPDENELKPWQHAQLCLEPLLVNIPFVRSFRKYFPHHIIRTRRDYGHFLAILETSAFLHQMQREKIEVGGQTYIRATLADAHIAKIIVENSLSKSIYELPEKTIELIRTASAYMEELRASAPDNEATFTITMLSKQLGWDRDTVDKWMKPASKKGYVTQVEESKGSKGAKYKLEEKELPGDIFLPSVGDLMVDNLEEGMEGIYDPITGRTDLPDATTDAPTQEEQGLNTSPWSIAHQKVPSESIGASVQDHIDLNGAVSEGHKDVKGPEEPQ